MNEHVVEGRDLYSALERARELLGVDGLDEVDYRLDKDDYRLGSDRVVVHVWVREIPEEHRKALGLVRSWLERMGFEGETRVQEGEEGLELKLSGPAVEALQERKGGISALRQWLLQAGGARLVVDERKRGGGSRDDRDRGLVQEARKAMERVRREGKAVRLRPMNSFERRVVHQEVRRAKDLASRSVGEDRDRSVEIYPRS